MRSDHIDNLDNIPVIREWSSDGRMLLCRHQIRVPESCPVRSIEVTIRNTHSVSGAGAGPAAGAARWY